MPKYVASIGMEVHAELLTRSKMFCRCPVSFGGEPNMRTCPVCLALPGSLPVINREAVELVLRTAVALDCKIATRSVFHRKNYFYPDLPKGYQISQYGETNPIGYDGRLDIPVAGGGTKRVHIRRVHLEEDTGKLIHTADGVSGLDYNRAGVPLMEIVTDFPPDLETAEEAKEYLTQLRQVLLYLGVCDGKMEEGSLRCEPNVSVRREGEELLGTKTELKNLNSFRSVLLGVQFEIARHVATLERGEKVVQETRGWNEQKEASFTMRLKEEENDYRYFPDPDLPSMTFDDVHVDSVRAALPELPVAKMRRYRDSLGLNAEDADLIAADAEWAKFFEAAVGLGGDPKQVCNWMNNDFAKRLNEAGLGVREAKVTPGHIVDLVHLIDSGAISGKMGKQVIAECFRTGNAPSAIVAEKGMSQITDSAALEKVVATVLEKNPEVVAKYKGGQTAVIGFLIGQVMKETGGRANPALAAKLVEGAVSRE
jgi:aspartyl-tRNA(Asn)/glutamyl-tRNA(Gln) amidotransferase subunit B